MSLFDIKRYDADTKSAEPDSKSKYLARLKRLLEDADKRKEATISSPAGKSKQTGEVVVHKTADGVTVGEIKCLVQEEEVHSKKKKKHKDKNELTSPKVKEIEVAPGAGETKSNHVSTKSKRKIAVNNDDDNEQISSEIVSKKVKVSSECEDAKDVNETSDAETEPYCIQKDQDLEVSFDKENGELHKSPLHEGPCELGEFTVLGEYRRQEVQKVSWKLPDWLVKPNLIKTDLTEEKTHISEFVGLDDKLKKKLIDNGVNYFFPVQCQLLPVLLNDVRFGVNVGCGGYRPRDICCSSPTGSGKTFAFVLPILQSLKDRVVCRVRAIVILPARSLAQQVFNVFQTYAADLKLKVVLIMGEKFFQREQESLVKRRPYGFESLADIVVATPGKLVDHLSQTEGFDLSYLRFLVIDEADRVFDIIKYDWLANLEKAVYKMSTSESGTNGRPMPGPLTIMQASKISFPFQKLLFSATLTDDSEKLRKVNLFQPRLFLASKKILNKSTQSENRESTQLSDDSKKQNDTKVNGEQNIRFIIPESLKEEYVICNPSEKVIALVHFVLDQDFHSVICFTNSIESTHRLCLLLKLINKFPVDEFSSRIKGKQKESILSKFSNGSIRLLVCTDAMARGIDLLNIDLVVSYDYPKYVETYIHRVGRTARAGREGTSVSLVANGQVVHLKAMRKQCQTQNKIFQIKLTNQIRKKYFPLLHSAVEALPASLKVENKKYRSNKKILQSTKA